LILERTLKIEIRGFVLIAVCGNAHHDGFDFSGSDVYPWMQAYAHPAVNYFIDPCAVVVEDFGSQGAFKSDRQIIGCDGKRFTVGTITVYSISWGSSTMLMSLRGSLLHEPNKKVTNRAVRVRKMRGVGRVGLEFFMVCGVVRN
jgi:hypothetical protein